MLIIIVDTRYNGEANDIKSYSIGLTYQEINMNQSIVIFILQPKSKKGLTAVIMEHEELLLIEFISSCLNLSSRCGRG